MTTNHARVGRAGAFLALVVVTLAALLTATTAPASAATVEECQGQLTALRNDTVAAAGSFTNAKDLTGLLAKVDDAGTELTAGKNADAVAKLSDYQAKLTALAAAPKPKVDPVVAATLSATAGQAAACIQPIG